MRKLEIAFFICIYACGAIAIAYRYHELHRRVCQPYAITSGLNNTAIEGGLNVTSGGYNFCFGEHSCPNLTTESCVVDIRSLSDLSTGNHEWILRDKEYWWPVLRRAYVDIRDHCGPEKAGPILDLSLKLWPPERDGK